MAAINQIKAKLLELEGGAFQRLGDHWLHKRGYENLNAIGMTQISNKTKTGTPDTLIIQNNGKYIFVEYTTQQLTSRKKLETDIDKCLNPQKTGIPLENISEIIICYLGTLTPEDIYILNEKCIKQNIILSLFNIDAIALSIQNSYPVLAKEYLSLPLDTGQILSIEDFIKKYNYNKFSTPIIDSPLFLDEYFHQGIEALLNQQFLLISGEAGIGKTQYSLSLLKKLQTSHPDKKIYCIFNKGESFLDEITAYFSEPGDYLIFIDDINRLNSNLDYLLHYLVENDDKRTFKIIATIRNYAKTSFISKIKQITTYQEITLAKLNKEQLSTLLKKIFNINHVDYLQRIWEITKGNPRLAVMAAKIVLTEQDLSALYNIASLYDSYFSHYDHVQIILDNKKNILTSGIISLFRVIDFKNEQQIQSIQQIFNITLDEFRDNISILTHNELIDVFENEIIKIADQVLATYLLYHAIFVQKVLPFPILLEYFSNPQKIGLLNDAIVPIINAFDHKSILNQIQPDIKSYYTKILSNQHSQEDILLYLNKFWFAIPTQCLMFIKDILDKQEKIDINWHNVDFDFNTSNGQGNLIFSLLSKFRHSNKDELQLAINLSLDLLATSDDFIKPAVYEFIHTLSFKHNDHEIGYVVQNIILDSILSRTHQGDNYLYTKLFFIIAAYYLEAEFSEFNAEGKMVNVMRFRFPTNQPLKEIRGKIFKQLTTLVNHAGYQVESFTLLSDYIAKMQFNGVEIVQLDMPYMRDLISSYFEKNNIAHCLLIKNYQDQLRNMHLLSTQLIDNIPAIVQLLIDPNQERAERKLSYEDYQKYRRNKIQKYTGTITINELNYFLQQCEHLSVVSKQHKQYQLREIISSCLSNMITSHPHHYPRIIYTYLQYDELFSIHPYYIITTLFKICGVIETKDFIDTLEHKNKEAWLTTYFEHYPAENINEKVVAQLLDHISQLTQITAVPNDLNLLDKYQPFHTDLYLIITKYLYAKSKQDMRFLEPVARLFHQNKIYNQLLVYYKNDSEIIYQCYLAILNYNSYFDDDGQLLKNLLENNPAFFYTVLDSILQKPTRLSYDTKIPCLKFLWDKDNYIQDIEQYALYIYQKDQSYFGGIFHKLFIHNKNEKTDNLAKKQHNFITQTIINNIDNDEYILFIIGVLDCLSEDEKLNILLVLLEYNQNIKLFKKIRFSRLPQSWSGSLVPHLEKEKQFLLKILPYLNKITLLNHKAYIEELISHKEQEIEREKKRDFVNMVYY